MIKQVIFKVREALFVCSLICFLSTKLFAQPEKASFRNLTSADNLPSLSVNDVAQDAFGFIWIATWDGDYRYDGHTFKKIPSTEDGRYVTADKKGGVWISFESAAGYYDPYADSVTTYEIHTSNRFPEIRIDDAGNVWASTSNGIVKFDPGSKQFEKEKGQQPGSVVELNSVRDGELFFMYIEGKQELIGRRNAKGIYTYEPFPVDLNNPGKGKDFTYRPDSAPNLDGWLVFIRKIDTTGILIINRYGWAYKTWKEDSWTFRMPLKPDFSLEASDALFDNHGNLWLNQPFALSKINITSGKISVYKSDPNDPNSFLGLGSNFPGCKMFFDRQGVLWITSFAKGISRLNLFENDFGLLRDSTSSPIRDVLSALESKDGSYWIGARAEFNGLIHYSADGKIIKRYGTRSFDSPPGKTVSNELSHPFAWSLVESADGSVWVGTGSPGPNMGGLNRLKPRSDLITRFKNDPADLSSLTFDWVRSPFVDGSDRIWIFNQRPDLSFMDPATEKFTNGIKIQVSDTAKNTWYEPELIASSGDILVRHVLTYKHYLIDHTTLAAKPFANNITTIDSMIFVHQDEAKKIWFVSPKGFGYLNPTFTAVDHFYEFDKLNFPTEEQPIIFNSEQPIIFNSDKEGNIWIATDNGIFEFDPVSEKFKHFGFERGLQGRYFSYLNYRGPSGKLYFGGNGGVNIFDPASIKTNPYPPEMIFTGLKLDGKSIMPGKRSAIQKPIFAADKITVEPDVLTISIDFAAIHFAGNNDNQFQYRLEGFDKKWRDGGTISNATYTNLPPGTYTLYIKGSNWDGVWSDGKKSIEIIVLPPWWRTWWAYTLYVVIFFFLLWQFIRYQRIKTLRKERERSQQKELEQAKEIEKAYNELKSTQQQLIQSEKMASLGELTAGIAHEIQNPLNFVNNFSEVNNELIEELKNQKSKLKIEEQDEILNDIFQNNEKINHHGKRADAIVKGMLQHSRSSNGVKEPTDINALCDEYLRLAYHGLRAKEKSFNASMKTDFDESIGNINIIPQDIGRVILNLINNAFYAVDEKKKQAGDAYDPSVSVSTKKENGRVEIKVADNGNGIPKKVVDKIFQPFFTTKPTGQGTGLGLSLSYDIVKAHGGELKVETKENEGSEFIIIL